MDVLAACGHVVGALAIGSQLEVAYVAYDGLGGSVRTTRSIQIASPCTKPGDFLCDSTSTAAAGLAAYDYFCSPVSCDAAAALAVLNTQPANMPPALELHLPQQLLLSSAGSAQLPTLRLTYGQQVAMAPCASKDAVKAGCMASASDAEDGDLSGFITVEPVTDPSCDEGSQQLQQDGAMPQNCMQCTPAAISAGICAPGTYQLRLVRGTALCRTAMLCLPDLVEETSCLAQPSIMALLHVAAHHGSSACPLLLMPVLTSCTFT